VTNGPSDAHFDVAFAECPLIAILRGLEPAQAEETGQVLLEAGFRIIEVPLNSPHPFDSISRLVSRFGHQALIGAGTVTQLDEVKELRRIGAAIAVSPHADTEIIRATRQAGMVSMPGILSATEAFAAIKAGANALKLFPMEMIGTSGVKALRAVLPKSLRLVAVGGVDTTNIGSFIAAGCSGFGLGGALFKLGDRSEKVAETAKALIAAYQHSNASLGLQRVAP
jgi:2-dehydro-3-deoxyphosphogalactonate aldolase